MPKIVKKTYNLSQPYLPAGFREGYVGAMMLRGCFGYRYGGGRQRVVNK